ncbi:hypothetical protein ACFC1R_15205 [Kitasatospora sp. NPDC056138]|uniref:hypothetical protein n=1 Tax=Kitasatospora sp. NPDC056138 TaxID=3345724 RepID=UPI0035D539E2
MTTAPEIAVIVTADAGGPGGLGAVLASVDAQVPAPAERVLLGFGAAAPREAPEGWTVLAGDWPGRAQARTAGWAATEARWAVFVDAVVPAGLLAAAQQAVRSALSDVAVLSPGGEDAERDYWALRVADGIEPASVWRRAAAELVGWWPERCDGPASLDHALCLDLTAAGWRAVSFAAPQPPRPEADATADAWQKRSLAVVSLHAGRESTFSKWEEVLLKAELPARTSLYVVDNSRDPEFTERLRAASVGIQAARGLEHLDFTVDGTVYQPSPDEWYLKRERNLHVARLYASVLPRIKEDLILTLEDDIDPPADAVRRLVEEYSRPGGTPLAAVSAAWDRVEGRYVCGGKAVPEGGWGAPIPWEELPHEPLDVGCVGGACTVWANAVVSQAPVLFDWEETMGWDGLLCTGARERGFTVRIHGGVRCVHHTWGVLRGSE